MGGRGAASYSSKLPYGSEYREVHAFGNVKFLRKNDDSASPPMETRSSSSGRVYATVNNRDRIKHVTYYDEKGKRKRQIDIEFKNERYDIHVHRGYERPERDKRWPLTKHEEKKLERIQAEWKRHLESQQEKKGR
ncbi:MAG: hypothetical protein LBG81_05725 [Coriobacteriaceae bacterium]|jgi:hypothetical protein|nr:hypothetical protein [Coriobacteriaceae bacterium]